MKLEELKSEESVVDMTNTIEQIKNDLLEIEELKSEESVVDMTNTIEQIKNDLLEIFEPNIEIQDTIEKYFKTKGY